MFREYELKKNVLKKSIACVRDFHRTRKAQYVLCLCDSVCDVINALDNAPNKKSCFNGSTISSISGGYVLFSRTFYNARHRAKYEIANTNERIIRTIALSAQERISTTTTTTITTTYTRSIYNIKMG